MNNLEMKNEFLILYDKFTNFDAPGYEDDEISVFLTKGQERVFFGIYNPLANKYHEGFEETESRRKDLRELVKGAKTLAQSSNQTEALPDGVLYDLPDDCLYVVSEEIVFKSDKKCLNGKRIRVKPITHDEYSIDKYNPFAKPGKDLAWRLDIQDRRHEVITDGTEIGSYDIRYIKNLRPIIIGANVIDGVQGPHNCEFDPILHKRIVDEAVKIATGVTDPEQYQIKTIENKENE